MFGATKKLVRRRCKRWARVVTKYKQVRTREGEEEVVKRVPDEWGWRCMEWEYITVDPKPGTREPYEIKTPEEERRGRYFPRVRESRHIYRPKKPFKGLRALLGELAARIAYRRYKKLVR